MSEVQSKPLDEETEMIDTEVYPTKVKTKSSFRKATPIIATDINGVEESYPTMNAASKDLLVGVGAISQACITGRKAGDYLFRKVEVGTSVTPSTTVSTVVKPTSSTKTLIIKKEEFLGGIHVGPKDIPTINITSVFSGMMLGSAEMHNKYIRRALNRLGWIKVEHGASYIPTGKLKGYCHGNAVVGSMYGELVLALKIPFLQAIQAERFEEDFRVLHQHEETLVRKFSDEYGCLPTEENMKDIRLEAKTLVGQL